MTTEICIHISYCDYNYNYGMSDCNNKYIIKKLLSFNIQLIENYNNIHQIVCGYNKLTYLPELPQSLTLLYCYHNKLIYLPELPQMLKDLSCGSNNLINVPKLPQLLWNIKCDSNLLVCLPELPHLLKILECYMNNLTFLPKLPHAIHEIQCYYNNILIFPYISNFEKLKYFEIFFNNIKYMDANYYLIPICNKQYKQLISLINMLCPHIINANMHLHMFNIKD